jgi:hypothetical protein
MAEIAATAIAPRERAIVRGTKTALRETLFARVRRIELGRWLAARASSRSIAKERQARQLGRFASS